MAAKFDLKVPEAPRPISELKLSENFENMGYKAVQKTVPRIKSLPNPIKGSFKLYYLSLG